MACLTDAQKNLAEENMALAWHVLQKNKIHYKYIGAAYEGLCKAAAAYDESKGKFSSYAYLAILNTVRREMAHDEFNGFTGCWPVYHKEGSAPKTCKTYSLQDPLKTSKSAVVSEKLTLEDILRSPENVEEDATAEAHVSEILDLLTPRQREFVEQLLTGDSRRTIETRMGISHNSINSAMIVARNRIRKGMPDLYEDMKKDRRLGKY